MIRQTANSLAQRIALNRTPMACVAAPCHAYVWAKGKMVELFDMELRPVRVEVLDPNLHTVTT
jgi:hypothetical protein